MKKILIVFLTVAICLAFTSCGNMSMGPGNYTFKKVHVDTYHNTGCFTIKNWHDSTSGIEVDTEEVGSLFLSEGTYIMVEDECPFCDN